LPDVVTERNGGIGSAMKIAISVSKSEQAKGQQGPYFQALVEAGAEPSELQLVTADDFSLLHLQDFDGVLLTGGADVDPAFYNEERKYDNVRIDPDRDKAEQNLLDQALRLKIPVLGICRGAQVVNVKFGGSLYQDLQNDWVPDTDEEPAIHHRQQEARSETTHNVTITDPESRLAKVFHGSCRVNSMHHQGIRVLGRGLKATAHAEDGLVEALEMAAPAPYLVAVQWHPEELVHIPEQKKLLQDFLGECRRSERSRANGE
jgi:gamma-glutamyl-gamma-aminobutyrate hydrolase PuuD